MINIKRITAGVLLAAVAMSAHAVPSDVCAKVARGYRDISRARADGVSFYDALRQADDRSADPSVRQFLRGVTDDIYHADPYRHLSPEGVYSSVERDCLAGQ
jgi:hypothetical protein